MTREEMIDLAVKKALPHPFDRQIFHDTQWPRPRIAFASLRHDATKQIRAEFRRLKQKNDDAELQLSMSRHDRFLAQQNSHA